MKDVIEKMSYEELLELDLIVYKRLKELKEIENNKIKPLEDYAQLFRLEDFKKMEDYGNICDDDGSAFYAIKEGVSGVCYFTNDSPEWATHVAFYGK